VNDSSLFWQVAMNPACLGKRQVHLKSGAGLIASTVTYVVGQFRHPCIRSEPKEKYKVMSIFVDRISPLPAAKATHASKHTRGAALMLHQRAYHRMDISRADRVANRALWRQP
jgi:hypothetical protein